MTTPAPTTIGVDKMPKTLIVYTRPDGMAPFRQWLASLKDTVARARIQSRLDRVAVGNLGDHRGVGDGVQELRLHFGPGYRVYFAEDGDTIVLLLCGGDKSSQDRDIRVAREYWAEYKSSKEEMP